MPGLRWQLVNILLSQVGLARSWLAPGWLALPLGFRLDFTWISVGFGFWFSFTKILLRFGLISAGFGLILI